MPENRLYYGNNRDVLSRQHHHYIALLTPSAMIMSFAAVLSLIGCGSGTPSQPSQIDGTYSFQITPSSSRKANVVPYPSLTGGPFPLTQSGSAVSMHFGSGGPGLTLFDLNGNVADGMLSFTLQAHNFGVSVSQEQVSGTGTATIAPDQIVGTFVGDLTYEPFNQPCHATDHQLVLTRTR